jgi:hypothetical protein
MDIIVANNIKKVVVFNPPPVEPGDAPTNIRNIELNIEESLKAALSMVLKPAVLVVTD